MKNSNWVKCDSRNDLISRLSSIESRVFEEFDSEDDNACGYLLISKGEICIPIFFSDVGLTPKFFICAGVIFVGITGNVAGYNPKTGKTIFNYRMPTVFHDFVATDEGRVVIQDETGFIALSIHGEQKGIKLYSDVIDSYEVIGNVISGETMEGELFQVSMTDLS